ncbi:hypothetical protein [uncultured Gemmobacter sp.]|uniref:hypothetical protein n=1 Tax=uncultured Gemmobacter sp. TaxID=1095917 RepID=UPI0025915DA1|nr:hypothetical protein [uncultured Gemmobacter sp.]
MEDHEDAINGETTTLANAISTEAAARASGDTALAADIVAEAAARDAAISAAIGALGDLAQKDTVDTADIAASAVTNAKMADMSEARIKGRASGAGSGPPQDLTAAQARTAMGLGSAATTDTSAYATAAQGGKADTAVQPGDDVSVLAETATAKIMTGAERTSLAALPGAIAAETADRIAATAARASLTIWTTIGAAIIWCDQAGAEVRNDLTPIAERAIALWTTELPDLVQVAGDGIRLGAGVPIWTTLLPQDASVTRSGNALTPGYPAQKFAAGTNYTTDQSLAMPVGNVMHHVHAIGQSFTLGTVAASESGATTHTGRVMMLSAGVVPNGKPSTGFVDLAAPATAEPPVISIVNGMADAFVSEFGETPQMVATVSATGGLPYLAMMRGSSRWLETRRIFEEVRYHAAAAGQSAELAVLAIHEGEADAALDADPMKAVSNIMRWRLDHQELAEEVYGQRRQCIAVLYSTQRAPNDGRASPWQKAARILTTDHPLLFVNSGPAYGVEFQTTGDTSPFHPTATGYRRLGAQMGRAALRCAYGTGFRPCDIASYRWVNDTTIALICAVPYGGNLVIDTSEDIVGDPGAHCGFEVTTEAGAITVTNVSVSANVITLTLASAGIRGGTRIRYASRSYSTWEGGDNTTMARGLLRGSVAHPLSGSAIDSYDWLIPSTIAI